MSQRGEEIGQGVEGSGGAGRVRVQVLGDYGGRKWYERNTQQKQPVDEQQPQRHLLDLIHQ